MAEKFGKIFRHLYKREYETENGISIKYYARFISKNEGRVSFALGDDLESAKDTLKEIEVADKKGLSLAQWRGGKSKAPIDTKPQANDGSIDSPFTVSEWAKLYPLQPSANTKRNGKPKRSLETTEVPIIKNHLEPFFGPKLLTAIGREDLVRYREKALTSKAFRQGKESKISITDGTVANHLSLLHRMLKVAEIEGFAVKIPVFDYLINRCENAGRALTVEERQKALAAMPKWLARAFEFATETCLDEGDLIRLTDDMVDRKTREVVPQGGRIKTGVEQRSYLTDRALAILDDIRAEKKAGRIVPNAEGLIFTLDNGQRFDSRKVHDAIDRKSVV